MVKFLGHWISLDSNRIFTRSGEPHVPMREREVNTFLRKKRNDESYLRNGNGTMVPDELGLEFGTSIRHHEDTVSRLTQ